jgi:hypothetical protein
VVLGTVELHGSRRIEIGKQLYFYPGLYLETQGKGSLALGDGVDISRGLHLDAYADMTIGTMVGEYTSIRDANHGYGSTGAVVAGIPARPINSKRTSVQSTARDLP